MAGAAGGAGASVPRNFKLLDELEDAEKSGKGGADVSLGLARPDDTYMSDWQASIFTSAGMGEMRLWSLSLHVDEHYPRTPPTLRFQTKINMDCVDSKGHVLASKVPYLNTWNSSKSMMGALNEVKALIARAPRSQPAEEARYA